MPIIVIVSSQPASWFDFIQALEKDTGVQTDIMTTAGEVFHAARQKDLLAVILDPEIEASAGIEMVQQLMSINAMIHVAWASDMTEEEFHESTEGLGILMKLSSRPDANEACLLAARLHQVSGAI